ncbi:hypothetical protein EI555_019049 [Monodon monoceros]|uniref:Uncharacterized protein n=1 Tax=Monodon monoceros TaxID=40151 RepID=A0A4U1EN01_MONMO|nr:hypothetical protein EI555_019049 [Monodon monoceros]
MLPRPIAAGTGRSDRGQGARAHRPAAPGPQTISTDVKAAGGRAGGAACAERGAAPRHPSPTKSRSTWDAGAGAGSLAGITRTPHIPVAVTKPAMGASPWAPGVRGTRR